MCVYSLSVLHCACGSLEQAAFLFFTDSNLNSNLESIALSRRQRQQCSEDIFSSRLSRSAYLLREGHLSLVSWLV